jgi:hypothetical protein
VEPVEAGVNWGLWIGLGLAAAVVALVVLLVVSSVRRREAQAASRATELISSGFTPVQTPDVRLVAAIKGLRRGSTAPEQLDVTHLFHRPMSGGDLYVFDLEDGSGDSITVTNGVVAIVDPLLKLPRLALVPAPGGSEAMTGSAIMRLVGDVMNRALAQRGLSRVTLADDGGLGKRYLIVAEDAAAAGAVLPQERCAELASLESTYAMEAEGDLLMVSQAPAYVQSATARPPLWQVLDDARRIHAILKRTS